MQLKKERPFVFQFVIDRVSGFELNCGWCAPLELDKLVAVFFDRCFLKILLSIVIFLKDRFNRLVLENIRSQIFLKMWKCSVFYFFWVNCIEDSNPPQSFKPWSIFKVSNCIDLSVLINLLDYSIVLNSHHSYLWYSI